MNKISLLVLFVFATSFFLQKVFSTIHKKNVGKIGFFREILQFGSEDETKLITEFTHGDALNFRFFMAKPLKSILDDFRKGYANPDYSV